MGWREREAELSAEVPQPAATGWRAREAELAAAPPPPPRPPRRGGTARELRMAQASGQQIPFTPATPEISTPDVFAASLGRSASLGTSDYPAAFVLQKSRQNQGIPTTFQEALADVRASTQQIREQAPIAYGAGQVAGALAGPGAATAKLVSRAPALGTVAGITGTGAVTGGISGFTEGEDLRQAAAGAGLGALTGGVVGGAFQGVKAGVDKAVRLDAARQLEKIISGKQRDARQTLETILGKDIIEDYNGQTFKAAKEFAKSLKSGDMTAADSEQVVNVISNLANLTRGERMLNFGGAVIRGAGGGVAGGGLELLSGGFIPPGLAAAGLGLYGAKEQLGRFGIEEARRLGVKLATQETVPLATAGLSPAGVVRVTPTPSAIGAGITGAATSMYPAVPVEATPAPPEATAPMPRLRQLAEEFRQRTGGQ